MSGIRLQNGRLLSRDMTAVPARLAVLPMRLWQLLISPLIPPSCRFSPSCSHYGIEAIRRHGAVAGLWLTVRRLLRCHPWGGHGLDPVPQEHPFPPRPRGNSK